MMHFNAETANEIQRALYFLGVRNGTMFPDFQGFADDIRMEMEIADCHLADQLCGVTPLSSSSVRKQTFEGQKKPVV